MVTSCEHFILSPLSHLDFSEFVALPFEDNMNLDLFAFYTNYSCVKWYWPTLTFSHDVHLKEELPPYYQPWMDIALRIPELAQSHELRSRINKVFIMTSTIHDDCEAVAQYSCLWPDATAEQQVSAETQRVTTGPPGSQHDDHGLRLGGGRERYSWGN